MISKRNVFIIQLTLLLSIAGLTISNLTLELQRAQNTIALHYMAAQQVTVRAHNATSVTCDSDITCVMGAIDSMLGEQLITIEVGAKQRSPQDIYVSRRVPLATSAESLA